MAELETGLSSEGVSASVTLSARRGLDDLLRHAALLGPVSVRVPLKGSPEQIVSALTRLSGQATQVSAMVSLRIDSAEFEG